jgi:hypothetical protein
MVSTADVRPPNFMPGCRSESVTLSRWGERGRPLNLALAAAPA